MHRFTDFRPQITDPDYGPGPSLFEIIESYYSELDDPQKARAAYIDAWLALENTDSEWSNRIAQMDEIRLVDEYECTLKAMLKQLDRLAEYWSDDGKLRRCHERLHKLLEHPT